MDYFVLINERSLDEHVMVDDISKESNIQV
jgi:hypothetical protein